jgi:hypothetical protein
LADAKKWEAIRSECIFWQAIWYQLAEDDIMYLFETGFGQIGERRKDSLDMTISETNERWTLEVPFRAESKDFRQEVLMALRRRVAATERLAADERGKIADLSTRVANSVAINPTDEANLKSWHKYYAHKVKHNTANPRSVSVSVQITYNTSKRNQKRLSAIFIRPAPELTFADTIG